MRPIKIMGIVIFICITLFAISASYLFLTGANNIEFSQLVNLWITVFVIVFASAFGKGVRNTIEKSIEKKINSTIEK